MPIFIFIIENIFLCNESTEVNKYSCTSVSYVPVSFKSAETLIFTVFFRKELQEVNAKMEARSSSSSLKRTVYLWPLILSKNRANR
jgi:hypothetical protein